MKKNILIALVLVFTVFACTDDPITQNHSAPEFVSAYVDTDVTNNIVTTFNEELSLSSTIGFTIKVDGVEKSITEIEGSGTTQIVFILESFINYGNTITIEYNGNGNAMNGSGIELMAFGTRTVSNAIEETDLSVFIPTLPPEATEYGIWLVIRTSENANNWLWDYGDAQVNLRLTQMPDASLFDIIIFATDDINWRPNQEFGEGYYCTLLNQENKYQNLKVVSWIKDSSVTAGVNMGNMNNESTSVVNVDLDYAYNLRTDGMDYFEGNIVSDSDELWYKFASTANMQYVITIRDSNSDADFYTGVVKATACDGYGFPITLYENRPAIAYYPLTIEADGDITFIKVETKSQNDPLGTFNISVEEQ